MSSATAAAVVSVAVGVITAVNVVCLAAHERSPLHCAGLPRLLWITNRCVCVRRRCGAGSAGQEKNRVARTWGPLCLDKNASRPATRLGRPSRPHTHVSVCTVAKARWAARPKKNTNKKNFFFPSLPQRPRLRPVRPRRLPRPLPPGPRPPHVLPLPAALGPADPEGGRGGVRGGDAGHHRGAPRLGPPPVARVLHQLDVQLAGRLGAPRRGCHGAGRGAGGGRARRARAAAARAPLRPRRRVAGVAAGVAGVA